MSATPTSNLGFQNFFSATLTSDITASSTDIPMDSIPNSTEGFLVIEPDSTTAREVIFYNSKTALKVVCPSVADGRGQDDTSASAHSTGATVIMAPVAGFWEAFQAGLAFTDNVINTVKLKTASDFIYDHVSSGMVWSGDSYGSTRAASMTAGVIYNAGKQISVSAVTARTFTASKDTYIDVDGTGTLVYTEVANNAASPALAAGSIRIGIIITAAGSIANVGSVNQGQQDKVLPIASSVPYSVTDSLGNLICPRDPKRQILGYRQRTSNFTAGAGPTQVTELSCPVIVPANRKIKVTAFCSKLSNTLAGASNSRMTVWDGAVAGTQVGQAEHTSAGANYGATSTAESILSPASGSKTYNVGLTNVGGTLATMEASSVAPMFIMVELV